LSVKVGERVYERGFRVFRGWGDDGMRGEGETSNK